MSPFRRLALSITCLLAFATLSGCSEDAPPSRNEPQARVASENAGRKSSWAEYRIIDIHAHIGTFRGFDLSLETLQENISQYGVRLALISNIDGAELPGTTRNLNETQANEVTAEVVRNNPDKLRGLAWTRPEDGSAEKVEPFLQQTNLFVGLKFHPDMNHFPADDPRVDPYLQLCEKYRVPAVFHCGPSGGNSGPERIYAAARRHPKVAVVLYHMGFGGAHGPSIQAAQEALQKGDADVYLETAQADPGAVLRAIKELGSERVLFGTDATYFGRTHYAHYEDLINRLRKELSAEDFRRIVHGNAERLFRLGAIP